MGLGNLFGGGKPKGIDIAALQKILNQGSDKQIGITNRAFDRLPEVTNQFQQTQNELGTGFETGANQRAQEFATGLQGVESPDFVRQQQAKAQELAFRNVPAAQQAIRENLSATGGLNRGAAIRALSQPVVQAAQQSADQGFQIQQAAAGRDIARQTAALDIIFRTGQGAALEKLGIDKGTAQVLLENGRGDILDRAAALVGIEANRTQGLLGLEQQRQLQEIARDQAKKSKFGKTLGTVGSLVGAGIGGVFGGVPGAAIGSSLGGGLGSFAGGGQGPDLSGTLALAALRGQGSSLQNIGGGRTSNPNISLFDLPGGR